MDGWTEAERDRWLFPQTPIAFLWSRNKTTIRRRDLVYTSMATTLIIDPESQRVSQTQSVGQSSSVRLTVFGSRTRAVGVEGQPREREIGILDGHGGVRRNEKSLNYFPI